jgi:hypothetical protein
LQEVGLNITCQTLRKNVQTNELVTNDTTTHVYGKAMLGISCIVDSIAGKMGLAGEKNVMNHVGVGINPVAQFQLATHVHRFKMLNALDMVRIHSFCV